MKFALLVLAAVATPALAVFSRESASDDSSVTQVPCACEGCSFVTGPVCATFDHRHYYFAFSSYCRYCQCLCTLNYPFPLVPLIRCAFRTRDTCPARGKLRQLGSNDGGNELSLSLPHDDQNNLRVAMTTPGQPDSWEQSGEVFD